MREICEAICTNSPESCQHLRFNPIYFIRHCYDRSEKQQVPPQPNEWVQHLERVFVDLSSFGLPTRFASEMVYTGLNQMILVAPYELPISSIVEDFLTACEKFVEQAKSEKKVSVDWKKLLNSESDYKGIIFALQNGIVLSDDCPNPIDTTFELVAHLKANNQRLTAESAGAYGVTLINPFDCD